MIRHHATTVSRAAGLLLLAAGFGGALAQAQSRTVIASEIGNIQTNPNGYTWAELGAYDGAPLSDKYSYMTVDALKIKHGIFTHVMPADDTGWYAFPYSKFKAYDESQVSAGHPSLFITATYKGKKRPVYAANWLNLNSAGVPQNPSSEWAQAVNAGDSRYVSFFINNYVYGVLWPNKTAEDWVALDNCTFEYAEYGVLDDNNHFVAGVTWDEPYPQNPTQYAEMIENFFSEVKAQNSAVSESLMPNVGSLDNWANFPQVYANVAGIESESLTMNTYDPYSRNKMLNEFTWYAWFTAQNRPGLFRSEYVTSGSSSSILTAVVSYMIVRGPNTFFAPRFNTSANLAVPPDDYQSVLTTLGTATAAFKTQEYYSKPGYVVYSRTYQHGIVYLNWSGATQTITLPAGHTYKNASGSTVTSITLADLTGTYVTYQ